MNFRYATAIAALAAIPLSGCLGGGGSGGGAAGPVVDMSLISGTGTSADPYVLPLTTPAGTSGTVEDWFAAGPGRWEIDSSGINEKKTVASFTFDRHVYDTDTDQYVVSGVSSLGSLSRLLSYDGTTDFFGLTGWYVNEVSADNSTYLRIFDADAATGQYGTFGIARVRFKNASIDINSFRVFNAGIMTDPANMPATGSATYAGEFDVVRTGGTDGLDVRAATGPMTLLADFGTGNFSNTGNKTATFSNGDTVAVALNGTITGNQFSGTSQGGYSDGVNFYAFDGTMAGRFYGPAAEEVAGQFDLGSNATLGSDITLIGGFWGAKQ